MKATARARLGARPLLLLSSFPKEAFPSKSQLMDSSASPDGQKGVARLPNLPECNPRCPPHASSHQPCRHRSPQQSVIRPAPGAVQASPIGSNVPVVSTPASPDRTAIDPFHWLAGMHPYAHATVLSNSTSILLTLYKHATV